MQVFLLLSLPGLLAFVAEQAHLLAGGNSYPFVMLASYWPLFFGIALAGFAIYRIMLRDHENRALPFRLLTGLGALYSGAFFVLLIWKRGFALDWNSLSPLSLSALGVVLFAGFYYRPPHKTRSFLLWLVLFGAFFIWWLGVYPERLVFSDPHVFPVFLHVFYLVVILAVAAWMRGCLAWGVKAEAIFTACLIIIAGALWGASLYSRSESTCIPPPASDVPGHRSASGNRPNIVLIVMDTARADRLSLYGYHRKTSPFLEELAKESLVYTNAISTSPWTLPAHASLFTGLYPREHGARNYVMQKNGSEIYTNPPLAKRHKTIAEVLKNEYGYETGAACANFVYLNLERGLAQGFDYFCYGRHPDYIPINELEARFLTEFPFFSLFCMSGAWFSANSFSNYLFKYHSPCLTAKMVNSRALDWIEKKRQPFFLFINYMDTHGPYYPPSVELDQLEGLQSPWLVSRSTLPMHLQHSFISRRRKLSEKEKQHIHDGYDGETLYVDRSIESLVAHLKTRGLYDNTLLIITSDHGEMLGEHHLFGHRKVLYEPLIRLPLLIKLPHAGKSGRITTPVQITDISPFVINLLNHKISMKHKGPVIAEWYNQGEEVAKSFYNEDLFSQNSRAVYLEDYKVIVNSIKTDEVYNLEVDPAERNNLVDSKHYIYSEGMRKINEFVENTKDPLEEKSRRPRRFSREDRARMKALGYVK